MIFLLLMIPTIISLGEGMFGAVEDTTKIGETGLVHIASPIPFVLIGLA